MGERDHDPALEHLRLGCRLTIVGGDRERPALDRMLLGGPSTSPLDFGRAQCHASRRAKGKDSADHSLSRSRTPNGKPHRIAIERLDPARMDICRTSGGSCISSIRFKTDLVAIGSCARVSCVSIVCDRHSGLRRGQNLTIAGGDHETQ